MALDSFGSAGSLGVGGRAVRIRRLDALHDVADVARLPFCIKVLLENLLRHEDGRFVTAEDVEALALWGGGARGREVAFTPERVLLQDYTGVPAAVDLAALRDSLAELGGDPALVRPRVPVDLVIDHSVIVEASGSPEAFRINAAIELERNRERYRLLRWAQQAFEGFSVVPPDTGICHQVNLEYLARVVFATPDGEAYPDTLVGTDSHTTMVNGLGVLGWGVGGIEAEAAMLGQPLPMQMPEVVGVELTGELAPGATATDLVLTMTELLRAHGVVGKFVEFTGPGLCALRAEHRATLGNMSPEYGATCAMSPIDGATLAYLRLTGRSEEHVALVEAYAKEQGLFHEPDGDQAVYSERLSLDLASIEPSIAGPARPQDRVPLSGARAGFRRALASIEPSTAVGLPGGAGERVSRAVPAEVAGEKVEIDDGHVVIAAITSCTNTSNPDVMVAAGLLARRAVERGLRPKPWVKTSLAPGSRVVTDYLRRAGLLEPLAAIGFDLVGYGCTTCIGNSGPLLDGVPEAVAAGHLAAAAVLSGNRNFEGRIHPEVRMNYLASPPLVVAYALAGTIDVDLASEPIGYDPAGEPVRLGDLWPAQEEIDEVVDRAVGSDDFRAAYSAIYDGGEGWAELDAGSGILFGWDPASTYVRRPPFLEGLGAEVPELADISGARALAVLGDSVTTDHISPAGSISPSSPAGEYLLGLGVQRGDFNSYGARRGNHEVMVRGTFANVRLRNALAGGDEGGLTRHLPSGEKVTIFEAAQRYAREGTPLVVLAGREYGSGSSRDWAAKGPCLLGVRAVIAQSFERIHRSNLIGMGILPLELTGGASLASLGITGEEVFEITGLTALAAGDLSAVRVTAGGRVLPVVARLDTASEREYFRHGGILPFVLRDLAARGLG